MSAVLSHWLANGVIAYRRHQAVELFSRLSDAQLGDIGLERFAIEAHVAAGFPWHRLDRDDKRALQPSIQGCG